MPDKDEIQSEATDVARRMFGGEPHLANDMLEWKIRQVWRRGLHVIGIHDYLMTMTYNHETGEVTRPTPACSVCHRQR
jgi:hypothetical protein